MKKYRFYTQEEKQFLIDNIAHNSYKELRKKFNLRFGTYKSVRAIESLCRRLGINHGYVGVKFKKGENNPFSPTKPIGSETTSAGKTYIKVDNKPVKSGKCSFGDKSNWVQKNRYVYERAYGEIPKGYLIIALDGNKDNYNPDNLYAVSRAVNMMMCANKWYSTDKEFTLTAIKYCELFQTLKQKAGE